MNRALLAARLIRGYVTISASGGFPDRFLNACRSSGVNLYNLRQVNGTVYADVNIPDYKQMPKIRRKSDMSVHITQKRGLPFVIYRRRNRVGLLIGVVVFVILLLILSNGIWTIRVNGNEDVDEHEIIRAFEENGVHVGAYIRALDITAAENAVETSLPELAWVSLNISGGVADINVKEAEPIPDIKNESPPCNIVAKYGGQISTYEVYEGVPEQTLNAAVSKGDLLISGVLTYADGTTVLRPASGKVEAKTQRSIECVVDGSFNVRKIEQTKTVYVLNFFGLKIPIYTFNPFNYSKPTKAISYEKNLEINGIVLPIGVTDRKNMLMSTCKYSKGEHEKLICLDEFFKNQRKSIKDAKIELCKINFMQNDESTEYVGEYTLVENINEISEILYTSAEQTTT